MASLQTDRNLLFGIVALRMNLIDRSELLAATRDWVKDRTRTLGQVLQARSALADHDSSLVDALVERHLEQNQDDVERSLAGLFPDGGPDESAADSSDVVSAVKRVKITPRTANGTTAKQHDSDWSPGSSEACGLDCPLAPDPDAHSAAVRGSGLATASRYQVLWAHARGGLGEIFLAEDTELRRRVALKEIQPGRARPCQPRAVHCGSRDHWKPRASGNRPGLRPGNAADGRPFYAMRFIKGELLTTAIRRFHAQARPDFMGASFAGC